MDGDHTIERSFEVTSRTLHAVFTELRDQRVQPEGILLKPNMVLPGYECPQQASDDEIAEETLRCFRRHVPAAVPGIVFLSGGQSEEEATSRLNAMNVLGSHPWKLSFSYGRALQAAALKAWGGKEENVEAGTARLLPPGEDEQRSPDGHLRPRHGAGGGPGVEVLAVLSARQGLELVEEVVRLDPARRAGPRAHDDRVGQRTVRQVADSAQQRAGGDAGRRHEDIFTGDEVVGREHTFGVEPGVDEPARARRRHAARACPGSRRRRT